ncbi:phosphatidate cytidylyltransferase [Sulfuricurvum sp. RIFCSPLOWO2_12_FULL_43_24]|uniref:phosphatidate cytidylyltransferase n=1 Tax=Sulfuricurvum sp. RIFCSPLOWO2_12_FULL_43_24 TaxID=1802247 RepID=UPI0008D43792|nr:phosphatidate cytidylyltransferase [Sulfuricurvum sp. RIFCSPLOWO2_12_FULL_43_24]OHD89456.1 MAG: phosphatidate cytidylyltransferase [Sulfuricurvum sp. RIFCSPLOWO2_12_FULL_43_24]
MLETISTLFFGKSGIVLLIILGILAFATVIVSVLFRTKTSQELKDRVTSWWIIIGAFNVGAMLNTTVAMFFFALISYLALKEYFTLIPTRRTDRRIIFYAYLSIVFQYWFAGLQWYGMFIIWIPVYLFLLLPFRQVLIGETQGFLENTSRVQWGLMMFVFGLSHLAYMMTLPAVAGHDVAGKELVLYLVVLTELNDVLQYLWGKALGKHKIVPKVSPNKTIEGFVGAFVTLSALAVVFSFLTPFTTLQALAAGMLISGAGFVGDVVISMVKRDIGVKDSGHLLPGHGGILDRVDSLTYTAPLFFHFTYYLYY